MAPTRDEITLAAELITTRAAIWQSKQGGVPDTDEGRASFEKAVQEIQDVLTKERLIADDIPRAAVQWRRDGMGRSQPAISMTLPDAARSPHAQGLALDTPAPIGFYADPAAGAPIACNPGCAAPELAAKLADMQAGAEQFTKDLVQLNHEHEFIAGLARDAEPLVRSLRSLIQSDHEGPDGYSAPMRQALDKALAWIDRFERGAPPISPEDSALVEFVRDLAAGPHVRPDETYEAARARIAAELASKDPAP